MNKTDDDRPNLKELIDWMEGRLAPATSARVAEAVAAAGADSRTARTVEWLRGFVELARSAPVYDVPPIVRQNLRQHFQHRTQARGHGRRSPSEQDAVLIFDSRRELAPSGVRGVADVGETWHLAFTTEHADVMVDVRRISDDLVRLDGQVLLSEAAAGGPVFEAEIVGDDVRERTVDGDELGRFRLSSVPDTATELRMSNGATSITALLDLREGG